MKFPCCDPRRLDVLKHNGTANAIEFVEVLDRAAPPGVPRQLTLFVRMLRPGFTLTPDNLRITGGERIRTVGVVWCAAADALPPQAEPGLVDTVDDLSRTLVVRTDGSGDFSIYTLSLVAGLSNDNPPGGFDPKLSSVEFSFKVECPSNFDCAQALICPPATRERPEIDYLAKDYQGFRRMMLDRMNLLVPGWTERSAADLGVAMVELLAYVADNLSYRQDVIANEAYLATARNRVSVRRHARLVDYTLQEGCNARAFVHVKVSGQDVALSRHTQLLTRLPGLPTVIAPASQELRDAIDDGAQVFEVAHDAILDERLNRLSFYTWGDDGCCLPRGTKQATLRGHLPLRPGDLLLLEEVVNPTNFIDKDADLAHRWVVRLTAVGLSSDPSGQLFDDPPADAAVDVTEVSWDAADALPFPLCLSVAERPKQEMSVARGNIVLADHGLTIPDEKLGIVPPSRLQIADVTASGSCAKHPPIKIPPRFRPSLAYGPLTHGFDIAELLSVPIGEDTPWWPGSSLLVIDPRQAMPAIASLSGKLGPIDEPWTARRDLLASADEAADFTVEIEDDGRARLRFGDDANGKRPDEGTIFTATYRVGNGVAGNVGAEAIAHIVHNSNGIFEAVRNPLPAAGGAEPESIEAARRDAPHAFRTQQRAVTPEDYARAAERRPDVQRAAASFRWTGSWYSVFVTPDRFGGAEIDAPFAGRMRRYLERFRMAGYDLAIKPPRYVPLDVKLHICVRPDYFRADVLRAVEQVLSSQALPDGRLGLFHSDAFSFGESVYLSRVIASAQAVEGVEAVRAERFQRLVNPSATSLEDGTIAIGGLEIAQLANNPNFRERGRLTVSAGGGK